MLHFLYTVPNIHPSQDEIECVITENKNMKEALTKATLDNEELQKEVVLKEVIKRHMYLFEFNNKMEHD